MLAYSTGTQQDSHGIKYYYQVCTVTVLLSIRVRRVRGINTVYHILQYQYTRKTQHFVSRRQVVRQYLVPLKQ
jgi:hypothetical protein